MACSADDLAHALGGASRGRGEQHPLFHRFQHIGTITRVVVVFPHPGPAGEHGKPVACDDSTYGLSLLFAQCDGMLITIALDPGNDYPGLVEGDIALHAPHSDRHRVFIVVQGFRVVAG